MFKLHKFDETHVDEDLTKICNKEYKNALLFNCKFKDLRNVTFKDCDMNQSRILSDRIEELLGFTATFSCKHFHNVELSELVFDLFIMLLIQSKGNDEKRSKLKEILGQEKLDFFINKLKDLE